MLNLNLIHEKGTNLCKNNLQNIGFRPLYSPSKFGRLLKTPFALSRSKHWGITPHVAYGLFTINLINKKYQVKI